MFAFDQWIMSIESGVSGVVVTKQNMHIRLASRILKSMHFHMLD